MDSQELAAESVPPGFSLGLIAQRDIGRAVRLIDRTAQGQDSATRERAREMLDDALDQVEMDYWGQFHDDGRPFWSSSGVPGRAWLGSAGTHLSGAAQSPKARKAVPNLLASLNQSADLRIGPLCGLARFTGSREWSPGQPVPVHYAAWCREQILALLTDAARQPEIGEMGGDRSNASRLSSAAHVDPFRCSAEALRKRVPQQPDDVVPWQLARATTDWAFPDGPSPRCAAMAVERFLLAMDSQVGEEWVHLKAAQEEVAKGDSGAQGGLKLIRELIEPASELKATEQVLRELPPDVAVLGLCLGANLELIVMAVWPKGSRLRARIATSEPGEGLVVTRALSGIQAMAGVPEELRPESIGDLWRQLTSALEGPLRRVLPREGAGRRLWVLAPGALRSLPVQGLEVGGRSLRQQYSSISLMPSLDFPRRLVRISPGDGGLVCALGEGEQMAFGRVAIEGLRRLFPPSVVAEPSEPCGLDIVEIETIDRLGPRLSGVRIYADGAGSLLPTSASFRLQGNRRFTLSNLRLTLLPRCDAVELWCAPSHIAEGRAVRRIDGDHLPPLTRAFLMAGAAGVLDLAWPVPDLVRALVVERYGLLREADGLAPAEALTSALNEVHGLLGDWVRSVAGTTLEGSFEVLTARRRSRASAMGFDPAKLTPFRQESWAGSLSDLMREVQQPVHLAAFRWWGG